MECQWNEKVPRQEASRPFGLSRLLLADLSWTSFARCSLQEESGAATSSALELLVEGLWTPDRQRNPINWARVESLCCKR